jgi:thymidine kinase
MAELVFFSGTMDSGKSTLALQMHHNHAARGRDGVLFTRHDRAGAATISSRLGLTQQAHEVDDATDFWSDVISRRTLGRPVDYLIGDEAQFYTADQVEQLARVVDELGVDVYVFGISTDFRARLFPGAAPLVELALASYPGFTLTGPPRPLPPTRALTSTTTTTSTSTSTSTSTAN